MRKLWVSVSGGRTSMTMAVRLLREYSNRYELKFIYANTGFEHEKTLEFLDRCDKHYQLGLIWVEAVVNPVKNKGTTHKVVSFEAATRDGGVAEPVIEKFGVYNKAYPHCNREMKLQPMESYMKSIDWGKEYRAIGLRSDARDFARVRDTASVDRIIYPLVDFFPMEKDDVLDWWEDQPFDLEVEEHYGNCVNCWKKSDKKIMRLIASDTHTAQYDFLARMERDNGLRGSNDDGTKRVFFRDNRSTESMRALTHSMPELDFGNYDRCADEECMPH